MNELPSPGQSARLTLKGPAGDLQALLDMPRGKPPFAWCAVVCHPHPLHGGSLDNKVVHTLARAFVELGMPAVRFNFRGVGESDGAFDEGRGESEDLEAVRAWAAGQWPDARECLAGFSFGAWVALGAALQRPPARLVTVAPPLRYFAEPPRAAPDCPWLLVHGEDDDVVPAAEVLAWAESLERPPRIERFAGTGHFFHGRLVALRQRLVEYLGPENQS